MFGVSGLEINTDLHKYHDHIIYIILAGYPKIEKKMSGYISNK